MSNIIMFDKNKGLNVSEKYKAVNTAELVSQFQTAGYEISKIQSKSVRDSSRDGFQKHLIRMRHPDLKIESLSGLTPEIIVSNSYDGTSAFRLMMGIFRLVCSNGLVVGDTYESLRVIHSGQDVLDRVLIAAQNIQKQTETITHQIESWSKTELNDSQIETFAQNATRLIMPENESKQYRVNAGQILRLRRSDDDSRDLWTVFNRIQENALRGGLRFVAQNELGQISRNSTRRINSIDRNILVNRKLWNLADELYQTGTILDVKKVA